jgi:hypothetical protein
LAINTALFHQKSSAHNQIMNAKSHLQGRMSAITHQIRMAAMALRYREVINDAACTVNKGDIDVEVKES